MSKRELGVVIARFQTDQLTQAHQYLLTQVSTRVNRVLILLGVAPVIGTKRNPLEYLLRQHMVYNWCRERFPEGQPEFTVLPLLDCPTDVEWVNRVDQLIDAINIAGTAIIFSGPDGAAESYRKAGGEWPIEILDSMGGHASKIRESMIPRYTRDFNAGIIYSTERRPVSVYPVVDIVITGEQGLLLASKIMDGTNNWRFVGGFVDSADKSLEAAAKREAYEETGVEVSAPEYIGSLVIDDWRYRDTPETVLSSVFMCKIVFGNPSARDDIDDLRWFNPAEAEKLIHHVHQPIFKLVESRL